MEAMIIKHGNGKNTVAQFWAKTDAQNPNELLHWVGEQAVEMRGKESPNDWVVLWNKKTTPMWVLLDLYAEACAKMDIIEENIEEL